MNGPHHRRMRRPQAQRGHADLNSVVAGAPSGEVPCRADLTREPSAVAVHLPVPRSAEGEGAGGGETGGGQRDERPGDEGGRWRGGRWCCHGRMANCTASPPALPAVRHPRCRMSDLATCQSQIHSRGGAWSSGKKKAESQKGEGGEHRRRVERPPPDRLPRISSGAVARARRPPFPLGLVEPDRRSDASPARRRPMSPDQVTLGCLGWSLEGGWPPWISPAM